MNSLGLQQTIPFIIGPTAVGKTQVALSLASYFPIEIITVDSAQIYKGLDIGTAKPTVCQRQQVPHHLIDFLDPAEHYSVMRFVEDASQKIEEIRLRNNVPLLVGGSMLYAQALVNGLHRLPDSNRLIRETIDEKAKDVGWPSLHAQLLRIDPEYASRIQPNDSQRIQRALEVIQISGKKFSDWFKEPKPFSPHKFFLIALAPEDHSVGRSILHKRIAMRFNDMVAQGFLEEVRQLRLRGDLNLSLPSMRCVGYRQIWEWMDQGEKNFNHMIESAITATRQLAKRQLTWLRKISTNRLVDCFGNTLEKTIFSILKDEI